MSSLPLWHRRNNNNDLFYVVAISTNVVEPVSMGID